MTDLIVAISHTNDGNMYIPTDKENTSVIKNRQTFLRTIGIEMDQTTRVDISYEGTNYRRYREVRLNDRGKGMQGSDIESADALITRDVDHALFLPLADCIGTVIFDPRQKVFMLSHVGRHSLEQDGAYASVKHFVDTYQSHPGNLKLWLTAAPGRQSYPLWAFNNRDFKEVVFEQLHRAGIKDENIVDDTSDSSTDERFFSHSEFLAGRRPTDGRYAIVAMMKN
jgi:copper oxidase (laccase) domain-containing protein